MTGNLTIGLRIMPAAEKFLHPVHDSVTNTDIDAKNKNVKHSVKLFQDDPTAMIYHHYAVNLVLNKEKNLTEKQYLLIRNYISTAIDIKINGESLKL